MERYRIDLRQFEPDTQAHEKVLYGAAKRAVRPESVAAVAGRGEELRHEKEPRLAAAATEEDQQKLIADLTRQLENMGPVNLEAVQEYDELEERYRFLETQNTDLTNSRRELLDVIARINLDHEETFRRNIRAGASKFPRDVCRAFGGGRADLQLMDENDALNCGIEIIAKPPGKQLQSISLLERRRADDDGRRALVCHLHGAAESVLCAR